MQRLRNTFQRSRTPTGADMKMQSSLDVPKTVRSASFDEIQLEAKRQQQQGAGTGTAGECGGSLLRVPQLGGQRSKSFDGGGSGGAAASSASSGPGSGSTGGESSSEAGGPYLEVPARSRFQRRRSSGERTASACIHCALLEEWNRQRNEELVALLACPPGGAAPPMSPSSPSDTDDDSDGDDVDDSDEEESAAPESPPPWPGPPVDDLVPACGIRVTLSASPATPDQERPPTPPPASPVRRRSIQRQEALFFVEPPANTSLDNVSDFTSDGSDVAVSELCGSAIGSMGESLGGGSEPGDSTVAVPLLVRDFYLTVPELKRDRAASVDSCFISKGPAGGKAEEVVQVPGSTLEPPPLGSGALRSRSVDIVLPTDEQARYKALAMAGPPAQVPRMSVSAATRRAVGSEGGQREFRTTPDWAETAANGDHLWSPTTQSGDWCYVGEQECTKHGPRFKCAACKIIAHQACVPVLLERLRFTCKATFRDVGVRAYREQTSTAVTHHWVHRRSQKGKCRQCGKSFQSKLSFSSKEIVALSCSWCKTSYHNKEACFNLQRIGEECSLGTHKGIVVPPSWIVKLPRRGSFKSSLRKSPKKKGSSKKKTKEKTEKEHKAFIIKPIPTANVRPVLVFINPKSGGNQGVKLLQKFQWHLNPRQVFDLTQGGPRMGLELFRKVPNLRVLACGGDGTVGWVLSVLDQLAFQPAPAVGVLPLGTGNDLARALGWGGGYTDEPISKILSNIGCSDAVLLDRWHVKVEKNPDAKEKGDGKEQLPLSVVNNYFSMGVDAHIALEFHEAREAHPERFNSRLRNKMFYGQMGGKDLVRRKWKGLAELVTLECDGKDLTPKLKDHKVHAVVFLNIPSYGGGTHPWNRAMGIEQATDDGLIEVVGLTTYQLPLLQAGGHGTCITQCRNARIVTSKTIPMQVDGEACKLEPSIITISLLNQACMLAKRRGGKPQAQQAAQETLKVTIQRINMTDYEQHHYDKDLLSQAAIALGELEVSAAADLEQVRRLIAKMESPNIPPDWCFVDSCTAERFFRVDRAQEHLHYLMDIAAEQLFILEEVADPAEASTEEVSRETSQEASQEVLSPSDEQSTSERATPDLVEDSKPAASSQCPPPAAPAPTAHASGSAGATLAPIPAPAMSYTPVYPSSYTPVYSSERDTASSEVHSRTQQKLFGLNYVKYSHLLERSSEDVLKAAKEGDIRRLKELHQQGFSLLSINAAGQTALHLAAKADHRDIVKYLLAHAPPSILDIPDTELGQTALQSAAASRRRSVCCLLVAAGASLTLRDGQGRTARQLALQANDLELAQYLESQERFHLAAENVETIV